MVRSVSPSLVYVYLLCHDRVLVSEKSEQCFDSNLTQLIQLIVAYYKACFWRAGIAFHQLM
jgi:hypothetical protein